jgi:succinate dehydrogenase flavin-adding protein (antitoxin of CptAB toxin-antitoxin module)
VFCDASAACINLKRINMPDINSSRKKESSSALAVPTKNELRWMARRGMLELDLLLNDFIDNKFNDLSLDEKKC